MEQCSDGSDEKMAASFVGVDPAFCCLARPFVDTAALVVNYVIANGGYAESNANRVQVMERGDFARELPRFN
jgi:hypothetical protein